MARAVAADGGTTASGRDWRIAIAWLVIAAAMVGVMAALTNARLIADRGVIGGIALLALLANLLTLDARRVSRRRARLVANRAGAILAAITDSDADTIDPVRDIERRVGAINTLIDPIRHRLVRRHRGTGLPTREPLVAAMRADLATAGRGTLGIFEFCDFDRLSAFGLDAAEEAMAQLAGRIALMVGDHATVAQIDRARIAAWFATAEPSAARAEIDAICYALSEALAVEGQTIVPEIASGRAVAPDDGDDADRLMATAIATLAGTQRRIDPHAGDGPTVRRAREAFALEQDLHYAIARGEFELAYQPLVDAAACRVAGAEALIRWRHPERGPILPGEFIPLVEASGLAEEVGMWALNTACRQVAQWRRDGLDAISVAVNLSAYQLHNNDLPAMIARTMARHGVGPRMLEIELTETVAAGDVARAGHLFEALRRRGVSIAIDDFGTGYSSLSYLRQLSFDKLKIDREFVTEVDRRPASRAICQSLIALARGLGIRVLAEGVERREEFDWLNRHGCTLFQGYYFARPMAPRDFAAFALGDAVTKLTKAATPRGLRADINQRMTS